VDDVVRLFHTVHPPEAPEERLQRHELERSRETHRQRTDLYVSGVVAALIGFCGLVILSVPDPELKKAALAVLLPAFTAWLGFLAGRSTGGK
jgi:hypothetical protein